MTVRVTLLTQDHCEFCRQAKELLDRLADEYSLTTEIVDLGSPAGQALSRDGGILFPPGILLDGEPFAYGRPSERKLRRALQKRLREMPSR